MRSTKLFVGSFVAWTFIVFATGAAAESNSMNRVAVNILTGIMKTAGQMGATKLCGYTFPTLLCQLVVSPVMRALYAEFPHLRPEPGDTEATLTRKGDTLARHFEESAKFQALVSERLAHLENRQDALDLEIRKIGAAQEEIRRSLRGIATSHAPLEKLVARLEREMATKNSINTARVDLLVEIRNSRVLLTRILETLRRVRIRYPKSASNLFRSPPIPRMLTYRALLSKRENQIFEGSYADDQILNWLPGLRTLTDSLRNVAQALDSEELAHANGLDIYGSQAFAIRCRSMRSILPNLRDSKIRRNVMFRILEICN